MAMLKNNYIFLNYSRDACRQYIQERLECLKDDFESSKASYRVNKYWEKTIYCRKSDLPLTEIGKTSLQLIFGGKPYLTSSLAPISRLIFNGNISITLSQVDSSLLSSLLFYLYPNLDIIEFNRQSYNKLVTQTSLE